jgi:hypothetical protein
LIKKTFPMKTPYSDEQLVRIAQQIEKYRAMRQRERLERAMKRWRRAEAERRIAELLQRRERMH